MTDRPAHTRNLLANWMGYGANLLVMFFLSPFVLHQLGDVVYGLWSLLVMIMGYLGLVEVGVRVSTGRFINFLLGKGDLAGVDRVVNVSLVFYAAAGMLAIAIAVGLGLCIRVFFPSVPPPLAAQAAWVLLLLASNVAVGLHSATFAQLLAARDRFDLLNLADMIVLVIRASVTVWVLLAGHGLIALAAVQVSSTTLSVVLLMTLARWKGPAVHFGRRHLSMGALRELYHFGCWAFIGNVSLRVVYYSAAAIIGLLLDVKEITYYSFAFLLVDYGRTFLGVLPQQILRPATERAAGRAAQGEMRWYLMRGSRVSMVAAVPLLAMFIVFGREFLLLWLKDPAFARSAAVLAVLAAGQFWAIPGEMSRVVLQGIGMVRQVAATIGAEAVCYVAISVLLVKGCGMGIEGVALGTAIPMAVFEGMVLPALACRAMNYPIRQYVAQVTGRWLVAAAATLAVCWAVQQIAWSGSWLALVAKGVAVLAVYVPIGLWVVLGFEDRRQFAKNRWLAGMIGAVAKPSQSGPP